MNRPNSYRVAIFCALAVCLGAAWVTPAAAQTNPEDAAEDEPSGFPPIGSGAGDDEPGEPASKTPKSPFGPPPGAIALSPKEKVWVDVKRHAVIVDGRVALREGPPIEMFACPAGTKEHESVVAVDAKASTVHAGLLAVKAKVGHPVQIDPYKPAAGTTIDIIVEWMDAEGRRHRTPAQHWVRHVATGKQLEHPWVFAGSGFWVDEMTGKEMYKGDSGDFICVSNFDTATLDLPVPSSQANADLLYQPFTERIPPRGTPVRLVLLPRLHEMPDVGVDDKEKVEQESKRDVGSDAPGDDQSAASAALEVELQRGGDAAAVSRKDAVTVVEITSESGIGRATIRRERDMPWPMQVNIRLSYASDKPFAHLEGFTLSTASTSYHNGDKTSPNVEVRSLNDERAADDSPEGVKMPIASGKGAMEVSLPMSVLTDEEEFKVQWVDLYR